MKISIVGKGGVGKTTISGILCHALANSGKSVLAIDGDPNPNLSVVLGIPKENDLAPSLSTDIIERIETENGKWKFKLKISFSEILKIYGQKASGNISLLVVGKPKNAGSGCMCGSHTVVRELLNSALLYEEIEVMVLDTEASLEHMKRGTSKSVDKIFTVVEPYYRSLQAASRFAEMAKELGILNIEAIANKVRNLEEEIAIKDYCEKINLPIAVTIPFDEKIMSADLKGNSIIHYDNNSKAIKIIEAFVKQNFYN